MTCFDDNSKTIGQTPLVKINRISNGNIYAKIESRNPASSVKCRVGANMIWTAEQDGSLKPGMEIIEPTSGNTGIALAFVASAKGYAITLVMPNTMSLERRQLMKALGANIVLTDGAKGMKAAIATAEQLVAETPQKRWMPSQFDNPANPAIHYKTTGPEIWNDTDGQVDAFIAGVGTGGTLTGTGKFLKENNPDCQIIAVEPIGSPMISKGEKGPHKIQGIGAGFLPDVLDTDVIDDVVTIDNDAAFGTAKHVAAEDGVPIGISSGAAVAASLIVGARPEMRGKRIVTIIPSFAERYLSTPLFD